MRKSLLFLLSLALILLGSVSAGAFEAPKVTVGADYLLGTASLQQSPHKLDFTDKGLLLTVDATLSGPLGISLRHISLAGSEFKINGGDLNPGDYVKTTLARTDLLFTYAPPFGQGRLRLGAGYSTTTEPIESQNGPFYSKGSTTVDGVLVTGSYTAPISERVTLSGLVGYGVGMTWSDATALVGSANLFSYRLAASYQVTPHVAIEVGYLGDDYVVKMTSADLTESVRGYFAGGRAIF